MITIGADKPPLWITKLEALGRRWLDPKDPIRCAAISSATEFRLCEPSFEQGLNWIFEHWRADWFEHLQARVHDHPLMMAVVLAGNTPAVIAQGILETLLYQPLNAHLKLPKAQTIFPNLLIDSIRQSLPEITQHWTVSTSLEALRVGLNQADLVIAYGSDETIHHITTEVRPEAHLIANGHKTSAAVIFQTEAHTDTLDRLAWDMLAYDQRGCLSPRVVFIEEGGPLSPRECAHVFAEHSLPKVIPLLPAGRYTQEEYFAIKRQRALLSLEDDLYVIDPDTTVSFTSGALTWPNWSLPRFLPFQGFQQASNSWIKPCQQQGTALACLGLSSQHRPLPTSLAGVHTCPIGCMQRLCLFSSVKLS